MLLSYCTNVHPAEDLEGVIDQLLTYAVPVRDAANLDVLGVGLWLPAELAHQLADSTSDRERLRAVLDEHRLEIHTLNAFPFGGFHDEVVKLDVYTPSWDEPERLAYTLACARVLADLLPDGVDGSISTLPLGWRTDWTSAQDYAATAQFATLSRELRHLAEATGRVVRIAIEPEPGCVLDDVEDVVAWLEQRTGTAGARGSDPSLVIDPQYVGVCLDTCHLAVSFADQRAGTAATVRRITDAGLRVVKVQASAALHVADPHTDEARAAVAAFAEPRYVHQVRELDADGSVLARDDLPQALGDPTEPADERLKGTLLPARGPWRVHFHVPLHHQPAAPLASTTQVLRDAVLAVRGGPHGEEAHLDVETYTWSVLPAASESLAEGIAAELRWARTNLLADAKEMTA